MADADAGAAATSARDDCAASSADNNEPRQVADALVNAESMLESDTSADCRDAASVKIQSLYRGCAVRKQAQASRGQWIKQFDPSSQLFYYYNAVTGQSQWEQPRDFVDGVDDPKTNGAVKIQSVYRSKRARDQTMSMVSGDEAAATDDYEDVANDGMDDQDAQGIAGDEQEQVVALSPDDSAACPDVTTDPRHTSEAQEPSATPLTTSAVVTSIEPSWTDQLQEEAAAALSIQCAFRQHSAGKVVERKRSHLRDLTDPDVIRSKVSDLMRALGEIEREIHMRELKSLSERELFPHLRELLASWTSSFDAIRDRVLGLPHRAERVQSIELVGERTTQAKALHDAMAEMRSECLALLRSIVLMNSYFVELDVKRINDARATLERWRQNELAALADPRIAKVVPLEDLHEIVAHVESALRRAMGLTDFTTSTTTAAGKQYEAWHVDVAAALERVRQMDQRLAHKIHLLHVLRMAQAEKRESVQMAAEDDESMQLELRQRKRASQATEYAQFLAQCRASWSKGLEKRQDDTLQVAAAEDAVRDATTRKMELVERLHRRDRHRRATVKLSIWEAVKEGLSVEIVRTMVFAEMQKARRLGYDFVLRTARSDYGETLLQIACWWGHEVRRRARAVLCLVVVKGISTLTHMCAQHLVAFLIDEGANVQDVDSYCNKFSLLHDAARRGHEQVVRLHAHI